MTIPAAAKPNPEYGSMAITANFLDAIALAAQRPGAFRSPSPGRATCFRVATLHHQWSTEVGKLRVSARSGSPIIRCARYGAIASILRGHHAMWKYLYRKGKAITDMLAASIGRGNGVTTVATPFE
jgi:hypothetical protein